MVADLLTRTPSGSFDSRVNPSTTTCTTGGRWWVSGHAGDERSRRRSGSRRRCSRGSAHRSSGSTARWRSAASRGSRGRGLSLRHDWSAARRPDGAPRARRTSTRRRPSSGWRRSRPTSDMGLPRGTAGGVPAPDVFGSPALAPLASLRHVEWSNTNTYATGRLEVQVVPMLMTDEIWQHPLCAAVFDDDSAPNCARPHPTRWPWPRPTRSRSSPRDACRQPPGRSPGRRGPGHDRLRLLGGAPVGFNLGQFLVGDIQIGKRGVDDLHDDAIVGGARRGAARQAGGADRRGHALCLLIMTGLSTAPLRRVRGPCQRGDDPDRCRPGRAEVRLCPRSRRRHGEARVASENGDGRGLLKATPPRVVRRRPERSDRADAAGPGRWRARSACCPC